MSSNTEFTNQLPDSLTGQLLISMPQLDDPNFHQTVSLICRHNHEGAMGVVINRLSGYKMTDIFSELSIEVTSLNNTDIPIFAGGPVSPEVGLVIHSNDLNKWESSIQITDDLILTSSRDILEALADGKGPERSLMTLGYAGWSAGQLEQEIIDNAWFSAPIDLDLIFDFVVEEKWQRSAALLGINLHSLSSQIGHA